MGLGGLIGQGDWDLQYFQFKKWSSIKTNVVSDGYFAGYLLDKPRQIILLIVFGFDVDTLEIALREQGNLVNKIFLVESTKTHKGV